jgi:hypothetical protein
MSAKELIVRFALHKRGKQERSFNSIALLLAKCGATWGSCGHVVIALQRCSVELSKKIRVLTLSLSRATREP